MLIITTFNYSPAESLKAQLLEKVKSEDLIEDSMKFKNVPNLSKSAHPSELCKPQRPPSAWRRVQLPSLKSTSSTTVMFRFMLLIPIRFHQKVITHQDGPLCTFRPSCSQYGREAIKRHGILGLLMTSDRLLRCYSGNQKYYPTIGQFSHDPVY